MYRCVKTALSLSSDQSLLLGRLVLSQQDIIDVARPTPRGGARLDFSWKKKLILSYDDRYSRKT